MKKINETPEVHYHPIEEDIREDYATTYCEVTDYEGNPVFVYNDNLLSTITEHNDVYSMDDELINTFKEQCTKGVLQVTRARGEQGAHVDTIAVL